jgi:hypothetical protein
LNFTFARRCAVGLAEVKCRQACGSSSSFSNPTKNQERNRQTGELSFCGRVCGVVVVSPAEFNWVVLLVGLRASDRFQTVPSFFFDNNVPSIIEKDAPLP